MSTATADPAPATGILSLAPLHPNVTLLPRPSDARGSANYGWLKSFHSFSLDVYENSEVDSWGSLRVLNEDRVEPGTGFGTHGHREFEIFSYIVSGQLEHNDSMGNTEILKRGDLQLTSAGTGIRHSEKAYGDTQVHFLQIWTFPSIPSLSPKYFTRHFPDEEKKDKWACVVAPAGAEGVFTTREGAGPAPVQSPVSVYATLISPGFTLSYTFPKATKRRAYIHVVQTSGYNAGKAAGATIQLNDGLTLSEGDGTCAVAPGGDTVEVENVGDRTAEVLLFDME